MADDTNFWHWIADVALGGVIALQEWRNAQMASKDYVREQIDEYREGHAADVRRMVADAVIQWDRLQAEREKRIDERHEQNLEWLEKIERKLESLSDALGRSRGH